MIAKLTSKNRITLPKAVTEELGTPEYFEIETRNGQLILTPIRTQHFAALRAKLAELEISSLDLDDAVAWARRTAQN